jgi:hypothetical protein
VLHTGPIEISVTRLEPVAPSRATESQRLGLSDWVSATVAELKTFNL